MSTYVQPNAYPTGNVINCRFAFVNRPLTAAERTAFLAGRGLPEGVGVPQDSVWFEWEREGEGYLNTLTGARVIEDAPGEYRVQITADREGSYKYRGFARRPDGTALAASHWTRFSAYSHHPVPRS